MTIERQEKPGPSLVVICGPTASGKTALALKLAEHLPVEIISADSRQVYRGMDIGTAKPDRREREKTPHHLIDVIDPDETFSAADFVERGRAAIEQIRLRGRLPLVVGGTGLYIRAFLHGLADAPGGDEHLRRELYLTEEREGAGTLYRQLEKIDPSLAARLSPHDHVRIVRALEVFHLAGRRLSDLQREHAGRPSPYRALKIGLAPDRKILYDCIDRRVEIMMASGLPEEVQGLLEQGYSPELKSLQTIGYRETVDYLQGKLTLPEAVSLIQRNSRRYAKRQLTWFGPDKSIIWLDSLTEFAMVLELIDHFTMSR